MEHHTELQTLRYTLKLPHALIVATQLLGGQLELAQPLGGQAAAARVPRLCCALVACHCKGGEPWLN